MELPPVAVADPVQLLRHATYNARDIKLVTEEDRVCINYSHIFGDVEISKGVKAGVKYLDEVFHNMQHSPLSAHYFELPVTKTRHSLGAWLFTVMSSKCKVTNTGEKGCHDVISNVIG